jgi:hypothetical protein
MALVCSNPFSPVKSCVVPPRSGWGVEFVALGYEAVRRGEVVCRVTNHPTIPLLPSKLFSQSYHAFLQTVAAPSGQDTTSSKVHRVNPVGGFGE